MPGKIGVLVVHGMGGDPEPGRDPVLKFIGRVQHRLEELTLPAGTAGFRAGHWADVLEPRERDLWDRLTATYGLHWKALRQFVISAFGDAIAYRSPPSAAQPTYAAIHARMADHLRQLEAALGVPDAPLVVVGHSLGSVILSDHIWDEQTGRGLGSSPFTRAETLGGVVTFGSTLPLFCLALDTIVPIKFPGPGLSPAGQKAASWLNFFDRDDVLGYPLRDTGYGYEHTVNADLEVDAGSSLVSWTPLSHTGYWTDPEVIAETAVMIRDLALA